MNERPESEFEISVPEGVLPEEAVPEAPAPETPVPEVPGSATYVLPEGYITAEAPEPPVEEAPAEPPPAEEPPIVRHDPFAWMRGAPWMNRNLSPSGRAAAFLRRELDAFPVIEGRDPNRADLDAIVKRTVDYMVPIFKRERATDIAYDELEKRRLARMAEKQQGATTLVTSVAAAVPPYSDRAERGNTDPNIVRVNAPTDDVEIAQSRQGQVKPTGKSPQPAPADERKRLEEEKARQVAEEKRQKLASERHMELERLATIRVTPKPTENQLMPGDWEQRLAPDALKALNESSRRFNVPRELLARVLWQESKFNEKSNADKPVGKPKGIAELKDGPGGVKQDLLIEARSRRDRQRERELTGYNELTGAEAISMAAEYLRLLYDRNGRTWPAAVASYNFGRTRFKDWIEGRSDPTAKWPGSWREAKDYLPYVFQGNPRAFDE